MENKEGGCTWGGWEAHTEKWSLEGSSGGQQLPAEHLYTKELVWYEKSVH